ncbi:MAG: DHH family phosphoesterase [Proteobacteria bacterium]|nr:DHH family phosphoesterase [Pseudomonadota bacterium]
MNKKVIILIEKIRAANSIAIITHHNPDPDAVGCALGLRALIRDNFGKAPTCIYDGKMGINVRFLPGAMDAKHARDIPQDTKFDLAIVVDASVFSQMKDTIPIFKNARDTATIDHHETAGKIGALNILKILPAAGMVILDVARAAKWKIGTDAANCLYAALRSDTGGFAWIDDTTAFAAATRLIKLGANPRNVANKLEKSDKGNIIANARIVADAEFFFDGKLALSTAYKSTMTNIEDKGSRAMNMLRDIAGVEFVALLKEEDGYTRVSFRSNEVLVQPIAEALGGGGHPLAAAANVYADMNTTKQMVLEKSREALER